MRVRFWAALAAWLLLTSGLASAQPAPQNLPPPPPAAQNSQWAPQPGMQFEGMLTQELSSKNAWVGEPITLVNVNSTDRSISGARMFGRVTEVVKPGQGRNAEVLVNFDTLQLQNGALYQVAGEVTHVQVKTNNNGAKEALGALGGMIVGNILGKWVGTNAGGFLGAAGGYLVAKNNREDVTIPANSAVAVRLVPPHPQAPQYPQPQYQPQGAYPPPPPQQQPPPPQPSATYPSYARPAPQETAPPAPEPQQRTQGPPGPAPTPLPD